MHANHASLWLVWLPFTPVHLQAARHYPFQADQNQYFLVATRVLGQRSNQPKQMKSDVNATSKQSSEYQRESKTLQKVWQWYEMSLDGDSRRSRGTWPWKLTRHNNPSLQASGASRHCQSPLCVIQYIWRALDNAPFEQCRTWHLHLLPCWVLCRKSAPFDFNAETHAFSHKCCGLNSTAGQYWWV